MKNAGLFRFVMKNDELTHSLLCFLSHHLICSNLLQILGTPSSPNASRFPQCLSPPNEVTVSLALPGGRTKPSAAKTTPKIVWANVTRKREREREHGPAPHEDLEAVRNEFEAVREGRGCSSNHWIYSTFLMLGF